MREQEALGAGRLAEARDWLATADHILIGAGAGLSAAAGYDYNDRESFRRLFPALTRAGFTHRYQLVGYPLPSRHLWGFWGVHVSDVRFSAGPNPLYRDLRTLIGDRDTFVLTSNGDGLFARNGFDPDRIYTPQGDYGLYQCLTPCTREVWDSAQIIATALATVDHETGAVPMDAVPRCPRCGGEVYLNLNGGGWYVNDHFRPGLAAAEQWIATATGHGRVVVLDLGTGFSTPTVIRWPLERIAAGLPNARFIRVNRDHSEVPLALVDRAASIAADAASAIAALGSRR